MTRGMSTHLSDEAIDDVLIGMGSAESENHLARCAECRSRMERFGSDVNLFNQASMAWSEARPLGTVPPARVVPALRMPIAVVASFAAAILAVAVAIPVWHHEHSLAVGQGDTDQLQTQDSQAQIAQDNELMQAVNAANSPQEESPIDEYGLSESPKTHLKARPK